MSTQKSEVDFRQYIVDNRARIVEAVAFLQFVCHGLAKQCGWWTDLKTGESTTTLVGEVPKINVPEKLCLIHSEISEGMEGYRKSLADDKLPQYPMLTCELADGGIRIFDLSGGIDLDLPNAFADKLIFNATRPDHKIENRVKDGGKAF